MFYRVIGAGGSEIILSDILQLALAPIDLSEIDFDDLEDFTLSMKENSDRFGELVTEQDIGNGIERRVPASSLLSGPTVSGAAGAEREMSTNLWNKWLRAVCKNTWLALLWKLGDRTDSRTRQGCSTN